MDEKVKEEGRGSIDAKGKKDDKKGVDAKKGKKK